MTAAPGDLDRSFGGTGVVTPNLINGVAHSLALQADGKIVVAGVSQSVAGSSASGSQVFTLVRYNPDGSIDFTSPACLVFLSLSH